MASVTIASAAKALEILGKSIVSATLNPSGRLIFTRENGQTVDAGDFTGVVNDVLEQKVSDAADEVLPPMVANEVTDRLPGVLRVRTEVSGSMTFSDVDKDTIVHALYKVTLAGNFTIDAANLPSGCRPGTQFAMIVNQGPNGNKTLTLTNIKKSNGTLALSTPANSVDILTFLYDGTSWYAGLMGMRFS